MCEIELITEFAAAKKYVNLFNELYNGKKEPEFILEDLEEMFANYHYQLLVAMIDSEAAGICGISFNHLVYSGKFLQLSNLFILPKYRKSGIANKLILEAQNIASANNIRKIMLDSYIENKEAHKSYLREGFLINAFHFTLEK